MAFDQPTRNRLQRFVSDARAVLTAEFTRQLQNEYGLDPVAASVTPIEKLQYLDDARRETARILRVTFDHYLKTSPSTSIGEALDRIVREHAFTVLNRLAALRMAEARGLLIESLANGYNSKGFQLYARLAGTGLGERGDAYRCYLFSIFDEFALDLRVLFDRFSPYGRLFPREAALLELFGLINDPDVAPLWAEDETIGWIYQYFNSKEERKKMRDESSAPRNSRELAVRNQFFTPRYVVEFLTDNTLGRIWYEMTKGETRLREQCRYLVRRPTEIFLQAGEEPPATSEATDQNLSQEELLKQPVFILHRPLKDPRAIRVLDPACGSMHFGLYAFDLIEVIYDEAWELEASLGAEAFQRESDDAPLHETYEDKAAFLRDVPRLVIERNLHGIDIDPRAVQIAGLSLWLRAQRAWQQQGLKHAARPQVRRSNIVCAEPMPGEEALLAEFIDRHLSATPELRLVAQLVRRVFRAMKLAGEAGSLLKIEEEVAGAVAEAKAQWLSEVKQELGQGSLFADLAKHEQQRLGFEVAEITDETFWERAEGSIYAALREYAEQAENGGGYQRRLFAEDAARGFAFIDVCRKRYDVVLMNPPFGEAAPLTDQYLRTAFPLGYIDLYTAFLDRAGEISLPEGFAGAITSRTAFTLASFSIWRKVRLLGETSIDVCADLGYGVLDSAMVETAAFTLRRRDSRAELTFVDLDKVDDKASELLLSFTDGQRRVFRVKANDMLSIPNAAIAYFLEPSLRNDFQALPAISSFAEVLGGNATSDDERFIRCFWEVPTRSISPSKERHWRWISKGGEYSLFYISIHLVVDWRNDGGYLGEYMYADRPRNGYLWGPKSWSAKYMGIPGVVWSLRSQKGISFRALPADCAMSGKSAIVTTRNASSDLALLGILNTERISKLSRCLATFGSYEKGAIANLPIELSSTDEIAGSSLEAFKAACLANSYFESDPFFFTSLRNEEESLKRTIDAVCLHIVNLAETVAVSLATINSKYRAESNSPVAERAESILELAESFSPDDVMSEIVGCIVGRWDIRFATCEKPMPELLDPFAPLPVCPPGMLQNTAGLPAAPADVPESYPLRISWPGILVDDKGHAEDIERRIQEALHVIWPDHADAIEQEACEILGVRSLRDYFRKPAGFFADHLKRYSKSRRQAPIYWPLSIKSGEYTLWLYYHRLNDQTLYTCVNNFVEPKLRQVSDELNNLRAKGVGRSQAEEKDFERLEGFEQELQEFRDELLRLAKLPWRPNLNDGVQITAAPLWKLFRLPKWQKTLKETWQSLEKGEYDWAHLAMTIWPERVVPKCTKDRSLAIAHELEDLFWVEDANGWRLLKSPKQEIEEQERRQQSAARERARQLLAEFAASEAGRLSADDAGHRLARGEWDDRELALLLYPQRMAEKCWEEPALAERLGLKLPAKKTKAARDKFIKEITTKGCGDIAPMLEAALSGRAKPFAECWKELERGWQDQLQLALTLWPDRVVFKCAENLALAEAHGLLKFFWVQHPAEEWRQREAQDAEIANEVARQRSAPG